MRVSPNNPKIQTGEAHGTKHASRTRGQHEAKEARGAGHGHVHHARAEISERAREMLAAKAAASGAPDVREDRIAELKNRIASGKYNVDAHAVADRLVDEHMSMPGLD